MIWSELISKLSNHSIVHKKLKTRIKQLFDLSSEIDPGDFQKLGVSDTMVEYLEENKYSSFGLGEAKKKKLQPGDELPKETKLFLEHKPTDKIPREFIKNKIEPILAKIKTHSTICGSYRRERETSADIDVVVRTQNLEKFANAFGEEVKLIIYAKGNDRISAICLHPELTVKIDFFRTNKEDEPAMILYNTGSKEFNIKMRAIAKNKGYLLNQKGLFIRNTDKKIPIKTEKGFFKELNMEYLEPHLRQ